MSGIGPSAQLEEALAAALRVLKRRHFPYMVLGGMALGGFGRLRVTQDVDFAVAVDPSDEPVFVRELLRAHFLPAAPLSLPGHRLLVCRYLKSSKGLPVQVDFLMARGPYQTQAIRRAVEMKFGGKKARVISAEDIILYKLLADRPMDRMDAQVVLGEQGKRLNRAYLRRWARVLGLSKKLAVLFRTAT